MDNVQKVSNFINIPSSQTFRSYSIMAEEKITTSYLCLRLYSLSKNPHKNLNTAGAFLLWKEFVDHSLKVLRSSRKVKNWTLSA
jgi:hypothetical protein